MKLLRLLLSAAGRAGAPVHRTCDRRQHREHQGHRFDLHAVVSHRGTISRGHLSHLRHHQFSVRRGPGPGGPRPAGPNGKA